VKKNRSFVLPSKTGHLLFPAWVPAYDGAVIRSEVLNMLEAYTPHHFSYHVYVLLCWWVLRRCSVKELRDIRGWTRAHLLSDVAVHALDIGSPSGRADMDWRLDSIAAEYLLTGMARLPAPPVLRSVASCCLPDGQGNDRFWPPPTPSPHTATRPVSKRS
jgi:hypothetical protein